MAERFQYPVWAAIDPETLDDPLRDEIQWFQEFSVPVLPIPSIAEITFSFIDPEALGEAGAVTVTLEEYQPLSEPVLPLHLQQPEAAIIDPATLDAPLRDEVQWFQEFSLPVLPEHQVRVGVSVIDPEALGEGLRDEIQWFTEFSTPVLPEHQVRPGWVAIDTETLAEGQRDELQWFQPLSDPIREVARVIEAGNIFVDEPPAVVTDDLDWLQALSQPMRDLTGPRVHLLAAVAYLEHIDAAGPPKHEGLLSNVGTFLD